MGATIGQSFKPEKSLVLFRLRLIETLAGLNHLDGEERAGCFA